MSLEELLALAFQVIPTVDLAKEALDIALTYSVSGYEAFYVALSFLVDAPLITADEKLVRVLAGKPFRVHSLMLP